MGEPVLDLAREELRELGRELVHDAGDPPEPFGIHAVAASSRFAALPRAVEYAVFDEFFGNSPELLEAEYGPYEQATIFLTAMDHRRGLPAGVIRLIVPSAAGFKSLHDLETAWNESVPDVWARTGIEPAADEILDVTTVAVSPEYRGKATDGLISLGLYQATVQASRFAGYRWLVTILDLVVLDLINGMTTAPFRRYPGVEPINYLDSPASLPVYCDFAEYRPRLAAADASMHGILFECRGLEAAMRPATFEDAFAAVAPVLLRSPV
jgi:hypothetical protein